VVPPSSVVDHSALAGCGVSHQRFANCADGVNRGRGRSGKRAPDVILTADLHVEAPAPVVTEQPKSPVALDDLKEVELITDPVVIASLTPDDLRRQLLLRAVMDEAQKEFRENEDRVKAIDPHARLNRPEILRRPSEKAAQILLNQLEHTLATAEVTRHAAQVERTGSKGAFLDALKKGIPKEEVETMRETLAGIPAARDKKESDAREAAKRKTHVNGDTVWVCENSNSDCYLRSFRGASLEVVRKKAQAEPGWTFVCPRCRGNRVRLADLQEVA
jgi:hypothetical protein